MRPATPLALSLVCLALSSSCSRGPAYYVQRGNDFFAKKNYEDAAIQYRKAVQQDLKFAESYYRLGLVEIERGQALDAFAALNRATELDPQNWEAKAKLGDLCISVMVAARNQPAIMYNRVVALADEFLRKDPNSFDGLRLKGYIAVLDRKTKDAVEYFRRAHELKRDDVVVAVALAQSLLKDGQGVEGESIALQAIAKDKSYAPAYESLYQYYVANDRGEAAEAILRQNATNNPNKAIHWIQLAAHFHRLRKEPEMVAALQKLLNNPKEVSGKMIVGDFYASIRRFDEAARLFTEGLSSDPARKIDYLKRISSIQQSLGKRDEALHTAEAILKIKPDDEEALALQASLIRASGKISDRERALEVFRGLVKRNPSNAMWQMSLGGSLLDVGKDNEARNALQEALRLDASLDNARYLLAEVLIRQGKTQEPIALADEILAKRPRDTRARMVRVVSLRSMKSFEAARRELKNLERDFPKSYEVQFQLALLALAEGKYRDASELFQKLRQSSPSDSRPLEGMVGARIAQNQVGDALRLLDAEVKKSPETVQLRLILASTASSAGEPKLASQQYEYLLKQDPSSVGLYLSLGAEQMKMGEPEKALATFQKANSILPNSPAVVRGMALAFENAGRFPEAIQQYRRNLELDPDNPVVQNNLAYLLAETGGDLDEAMRLIQQAIRKLPGHPALADTLGWIYLKKNMTGSAHQVFAGLVKKDPRNPSFQYHLGSVLYAKGDKEGARSALKSGLENKPSPSTEKKIRQLLAVLG